MCPGCGPVHLIAIKKVGRDPPSFSFLFWTVLLFHCKRIQQIGILISFQLPSCNLCVINQCSNLCVVGPCSSSIPLIKTNHINFFFWLITFYMLRKRRQLVLAISVKSAECWRPEAKDERMSGRRTELDLERSTISERDIDANLSNHGRLV